MATTNMNNLTTLIKRLEAATSRLEDMASSTNETQHANKAVSTPSNPPPAPSIKAAPPVPDPEPEQLPESVENFDTFINGPVKKYVNLSDEIGGPISEQASSVLRAFVGQRKFVLITTKSKKPDMSASIFMQLLKPLQECIGPIHQIRDANHGSKVFNHLSCVSESIEVLAWVTVDTKPYKHVEESLGSAQYWGNRVLKEYKESDPLQAEWVRSYYSMFRSLAEYVKQTFPQGIPWNPKGVTAEEALKVVDSSAPKTQSLGSGANGGAGAGAGAPPPPPPGPPPPPMRFDDAPKPTPTPAGGIDAVFSELNKGEAVTKGLRKVKPDQMTHKNPSLRAGATVPMRSESQSSISSNRGKSPAPGKKPKPENMRTKKPPVRKLDGNKWIIENYDNESQPIEIEASITQSILISRCNKTTIVVKGKANAISIDNSARLSLIVESLVSSIDVIKSTNFALQVLGMVPTILMDQVDGGQVYLGKDSLKTEVFSSKSSSINLNLIEGDEGDYKEVALPEQIRTYIGKDGRVASEIIDHAG